MQSAVKYYYNINKIFMSKLGIWPEQSTLIKILLPTIFTAFLFSIGFFEFVRFTEIWRNLTENCESFIMMLLALGACVKLYLVVLKNENVKYLLWLIDYHWSIFTHYKEVQVMHEYATVGRKMTISYAVIIYTCMSLYMLIPVTPQLLDLVAPLNESRPYKYLFDVDYSFDREVYYYPVLLYTYITTIIAISIMVTTDTSYLSLAQHACGLFAAIGYRLENLTLDIDLKSYRMNNARMPCDKSESADYDDRIYRELILVLQKHQLSIEYVDLLESLYMMYSFTMILFHFVVMSLLGIQIVSLLNNKGEMIRYLAILIGGFLHLLVLSYPGQEIMDHSINIFDKTYNMLWYKMSQRTTQLVKILLCRGLVPCTLTAGKMYVLSFQNYASIMQATFSYFTALSSFK